MARKVITDAAQEEVLTRSARRCALCFGFDGSLERVRGQLAHVDGDPSNSASDNLAYLCLLHHDEYDSRTSQSKGITERELRNYRNRLYEAIAKCLHHSNGHRLLFDPGSVKHDQAAFHAGDATLSEIDVENFLHDLEWDHACHSADYAKVSEFLHHFSRESHRFIVTDLSATLDDLLDQLKTLQLFISTHFFVYPDLQPEAGQNVRRCLYPERNSDRCVTATLEQNRTYMDYSNELLNLTKSVRESYAEYRRTIKRTLLV